MYTVFLSIHTCCKNVFLLNLRQKLASVLEHYITKYNDDFTHILVPEIM